MPSHLVRWRLAVACAALLAVVSRPWSGLAQSRSPADSVQPASPAAQGVVDRSAQWSPDGEWLLVRSLVDDQPRLRLLNMKDRFWRKIPIERGVVEAPTWSPDGHTVACVIDGRLTTVDVVGLVPAAVSGGPSDRVTAYTWSPQSQQLAALLNGEVRGRRLLIFDRENGAATHTTAVPTGYREPGRLDWSPRGTSLLVHSAGGSWLYDTVKRLWQPISGLSGPVGGALWDPGGNGVLIAAGRSPAGTDLVLVDTGGRIRFRYGRSEARLTPLMLNWRARRVLLGDRSGRAVLATPDRRIEAIAGVRTLAFIPLAASPSVTGEQAAPPAAVPALWLLGVAATTSEGTRQALAGFNLPEYRPLPLASPGWSTGYGTADGQSKVMLLPAGADELAHLREYTSSERVHQMDPAPGGRSFALVSERSGRLTQRTVQLRAMLSGTGTPGVRLGPPKGPDRPNWMWPLATVALVTGTFVLGVLLTSRRTRH